MTAPAAHHEPPRLAPMPAAYVAWLRTVSEAVLREDRLRALWVTGAVARGAQDAASDLDLCVTVSDDALDDLVGSAEEWIRALLDPVNVERMGTATGWFVLTERCERVDLLLEPVSAIPSSPHARRVPVVDKDRLVERLPSVSDPEPSAEVVARVVTEAIRQMANFPVVFVREDWLLGVVAVQQLHLFLYELFVQAGLPRPPTGPKQWSSKLTPDHRALLEGLPVPQPEPGSVIRAHRAAVDLFESTAPEICSRVGVDWPERLHGAVRRYRATAYPAEWSKL